MCSQPEAGVQCLALQAYAIPTLWSHPDTTTMTLYGAYEDLPAPQRQEAAKEAAPVAPCPTHGYNKDGHLELKQVSLHLASVGTVGSPPSRAPRWSYQ